MSGLKIIWAVVSTLFCIWVGYYSTCSPIVESTRKIGLSKQQIAQLDSLCSSYIARGNTIGLSLSIAFNGIPVYERGFGWANLSKSQTAQAATIYPVASVSKMITAVATLKMVEEGLLRLEDKVQDYIHNLPVQEYIDEITIEHLLRHQSGLIDHEDWLDSIYINHKREFTEEEFLQFINRPLFFQPGTLYSYSNSGYRLLSMVLEEIHGHDFHHLIQNRIGQPLQLPSLGMWPRMWHLQQAAMGYQWTEYGIDTSFHMMTKGMKGGGGLGASVTDLLKFTNAVTTGTFLQDSSKQRLISPSIIHGIQVDYGLGVKKGEYAGRVTFGHSGGYDGTGWAIIAHYPESGYTFAAAINTNYSPDEVWTLRHQVMPIVLGLEVPQHSEKPIPDARFYAGSYATMNSWGKHLASRRIVAEENGRLFWDNPDTNAPGSELFPVDQHRFSWNAYPFDEFKFHVVNGNVVAVSEYYDGMFANIRMKL